MSSVVKKYRNLYGSSAYEGPNGFRACVLKRNSQCQALVYGEQCREHDNLQLHHLCEHNGDAEKFFSWRDVVMLCPHHHVSGPGDSGKYSYVPTIGWNGEVYEHSNIVGDMDKPSTFTSMTEATAGTRKLTIADVLARVRR
jgi:hypothetical protein